MLSLSVGNASFGTFIPGVARDYTATAAATVTSTAGDATLRSPARTISPTARSRSRSPCWSTAGALPTTLRTYTGPVSNDPVPIAFKQSIGATDALRTGTYATTLTLTLSTTQP